MGFPIRNEGVNESSHRGKSSKLNLAILLTPIRLFLYLKFFIQRLIKWSLKRLLSIVDDLEVVMYWLRGLILCVIKRTVLPCIAFSTALWTNFSDSEPSALLASWLPGNSIARRKKNSTVILPSCMLWEYEKCDSAMEIEGFQWTGSMLLSSLGSPDDVKSKPGVWEFKEGSTLWGWKLNLSVFKESNLPFQNSIDTAPWIRTSIRIIDWIWSHLLEGWL